MVKREEREIRVFDLFISICQRWRSLLICLVVGAVLLGGYGWLKSDAPVAEPLPEAEAEEKWEEILAPGEIIEVKQLHSVILEYEGLMAQQDSIPDLSERLTNLERVSYGQSLIAGTRRMLSDDQEAYLEYLMGDENIIPGDENTYSHKDNAEAVSSGRHINLKYVVVGAFGGLVLAALMILIKYIASGNIRSREEAEETLRLSVVGSFDGSSRFYDKRKTALDKWLRKRKHRNKKKSSYEETVDVIAARIRIAAEKEGLKSFCIAVDPGVVLESVEPKEFLDDIKKKAGSDLSITVESNILKNADSLQSAAEADGVLLVIQTESSRFMDVQYERMLCEGYQSQVIGAILVE